VTATARRLIAAFAVLGLGASAWSSYVHYALLTRPGYTSFCDINGTVSCTQAYLSPYGSLWGVPVALGGLLFFTIVLLLAGFGGRRPAKNQDATAGYIFAASTVALAVVFYLAWASFFKLHAVCLLCAATYVAVIGIFIVSGAASSLPMTALSRRVPKDAMQLLRNPVPLGLALVAAVGFISLVSAFPREEAASPAAAQEAFIPLTDQQRAEFIKWYEMQPRVDVPLDAGGAKVLVVKFNDYQCPPCRNTYYAYKPILEKYAATGQVKYVLKHFPLEPECNTAITSPMHVAACEAASAVVMARRKGTAEKLEAWLFANQESLTRDVVRQAAADVGGVPDFDAQYERAMSEVKTDAGLGALLGFRSTPTFVINGHVIAGGLPPAAFDAALEYEIKK
jgi:uncharacterized membrane protein/protein-disulfide isomerase